MPVLHDREIENVWQAFSAVPWAIEEQTGLAMREVIQLRLNGQKFTDEEIAQRLGHSVEPYQIPQSRDLVMGEGDGTGPRVINGVAILPLQGVMSPRMSIFMRFSGGTSTQEFGKWFLQAYENSAVKAIVFDVNSPGGEAHGNQELIDQIGEIQARFPKKPLKAVCTGYCASAAYYVASVADEIIASPSSYIGSIGTAVAYEERSKAIEAAGRSVEIIRAGENKMVPSGTEPLNDHSRGLLQERVDKLNAMFIGAVAKNRNVSEQTVKEKFGQGKIFLAADAVAVGMIDRVGTLSQVLAEFTGSSPRGGGSSISKGKENQMDPKVLAAMVERKLITQETTPEVASVALQAFAAGQGVSLPEDPAQIIALLKSSVGKNRDIPPAGQSQEGNQTPPDTMSAEATLSAARNEAMQLERKRISQLQVRGQLLQVDPQTIEQAINSGLTIEQALLKWTEGMSQTQTPVNRGQVVAHSADKFEQAATAALCRQIGGIELSTEEQQLGKDLFSSRLIDIAKQSLKLHGQNERAIAMFDDEEVAKQAAEDGGDYALIEGQISGGFNRPGDFPNLLSNVQGRMLMQIQDYSETTYREWAHRLQDVSDFKPKTLLKTGEIGELSIIQDGEPSEEVTFSEEASFISVDRYGGNFMITPIMIANNDMQSWLDAFEDILAASDATLNRLLINLLTGNITLPDGNPLYDAAAHKNLVTSGGAPSTTELAKMRLLLRKMLGVSKKRKLKYKVDVLLYPSDLETSFDKLLRVDLKVVSDDENNPDLFRGRVKGIVEPELDDHSDKIYYGFANPQRARSIVYAKMKGYNRGRIETYWDQKRKCRVYDFEDRFGGAINNYRGTVRNNGESGGQ